jgi:phage protein D
MGIQAKTADEQAEEQEAVLEYNAAVARQGKETTRRAALEEKHRIKERTRRTLARNRALTAGSGLQMAGSPFEAQLAVIEDAADELGLADYRSEISVRRQESQAQMFEMQAKAAKRAGKLGVAAALVGGVSQIATFRAKQKMFA